MKYTEARRDLDNGKIIWRAGWANKAAFYKGTPHNSPYHGLIVDQNDKVVHDIHNDDREATDWESGSSRAEHANAVFQAPPVEAPKPVIIEEPEVTVELSETQLAEIEDDEFEDEVAAKEKSE